jgi:hypothetical protein
LRCAPKARSVPTSRVRSKTDMRAVFRTPAATMIVITAFMMLAMKRVSSMPPMKGPPISSQV